MRSLFVAIFLVGLVAPGALAQAQDDAISRAQRERLQRMQPAPTPAPPPPNRSGSGQFCIAEETINHYDHHTHFFTAIALEDGRRHRISSALDRLTVTLENVVAFGSDAADIRDNTEIETLRAAAAANATVSLMWDQNRELKRIIVLWHERCTLPAR